MGGINDDVGDESHFVVLGFVQSAPPLVEVWFAIGFSAIFNHNSFIVIC